MSSASSSGSSWPCGNSTTGGSGGSSSGGSATPACEALANLVTTTTSVPTATLDKIGGGTTTSPPKTISGAALTSGGKPEVLYIGAEYCPYCATERWAMVVTLTRFGTLSGLGLTRSAAANGAGQAEPYPNTATWTLRHTTFASQFLTFSPSRRTRTSLTRLTGF